MQNYKPKSFIDLPYKHIRSIALFVAYGSLIASIIAIVLSYLTFAALAYKNLEWVYIMMLIKAVTWSPFVGWEYYDLIFEHLYMDTQYQLNQIRPGEEYIKPLASPLLHK